MMATACAVAIVLYSCGDKIDASDALDLTAVPLQTIDNMFAVQTKNGVVVMRMEADLMERYENDSTSRETFPKGVAIYSYTDEGLLETTIYSDDAVHETSKKYNEELWAAYGNVIIQNVIKREVMETDTLYWDRAKGEIHTDSYIRMYSPDGFMQGYGMRSDDKARNSIILRPFNSFGVVV
ncbi:MAG: LPS export ABC transporter periplasmic protein LptC, partial [Bacteroidales bacterium]|nr:LPS export ABC transporter periplasmic protein LptC [Bacteroidales bacterium]